MEDKPKRQRHSKEERKVLFVQLFIEYYLRLKKGSMTTRDLFRGKTSTKGKYVSLAQEFHLGGEVSPETVIGAGILAVDETKPYENNSPYVNWNTEFPSISVAETYIKFSETLREEKAVAKQIAVEEKARLAKETPVIEPVANVEEPVKTNFPSSIEVEKATTTNEVEDEVESEYDFTKMSVDQKLNFLCESEMRRRKLDAQRARNEYEKNAFIEKLIKGE
jgi:hypothetical protein